MVRTIVHHDGEDNNWVAASCSVSTEDAQAQIAAGVKLIRERQAGGALVDYSKAVLEMSIVAIYKLPDLFDALALPRSTRIAILLPPDPINMHKYTFYDDTANNRGYIVTLHWERSQPMAWLTDG